MSLPNKAGQPAGSLVVVALDASTDCGPMVDAAAALAARLGAALRGVCVEDQDLMRLAGLPFCHEIAFASDRPRPLDPIQLSDRLARQMGRLEKLLAASARRQQVPWEMRSCRGDVGASLVAESADAQLLILGYVRRVHHTSRGVGRVAGRVMAGAAPPVLLLPPGARIEGPVAVLLPADSQSGKRLLTVANRLGRRTGAAVRVLYASDSADGPPMDLGALISPDPGYQLVPMPDGATATVAAALAAVGGGLLLVDAAAAERADQLLAVLGRPVVLVRRT